MESFADVLLAALGIALVMWPAFWVVRLAVRYGVDDALSSTGTSPGGGRRSSGSTDPREVSHVSNSELP